MHPKRLLLLLGVLTAGFAAPAWAKPQLTISISPAKEVTEGRGSKQTRKMVATHSAVSGDVVEYVVSYSNVGDEPATHAVIDDPIPKGTTFVANSAGGPDAEVSFSVDGGKTFASATALTREVQRPDGTVQKRAASPADYTHIRWTLKSVAPGASGTVRFRVRID